MMRLVTAEELLSIPEVHARCDLFRGEVVWTSFNSGLGGEIATEFVWRMGNHVRQRGLGACFSGCGFILERGPDTVLGPDVAFVRAERLPAVIPEGYMVGPPDIAVEIVCPDDSARYVLDKIVAYLEAGTPIVWVVEPTREVVMEYRGDGRFRVLSGKDRLGGGDVLPGFEIVVGELFAER